MSPQEDEVKIAHLMVVVDRIFDRCNEIVRHGSRLLYRLRNTKPWTCYPKPFTLVALETNEKEYRQLFMHFSTLDFRASRMPMDVRRRLTGIRFTKEQWPQLQRLLDRFATY
jgi:hypothetical protein